MSGHTHWQEGTVVTYQEIWEGKLWSARPVRVVEDRTDLLALWCPAGTPVKGPYAPWRPGRSAGPEYFVAMFTHQDWRFSDFTWQTSNLMLLRPGEWHAVWVSWNGAGESIGWYVNFQRPFTRTGQAIQTMDLMLDLLVKRDMNRRWKDEDEFEALVSRGIIGDEEAATVRQEAAGVIERIEASAPPFCEPWHEWLPDPAWGKPALPEEWESLDQ